MHEHPTRSVHGRTRVLIVENDESMRQTLIDLLHVWGYNVFVAAGNGDQLLADAISQAQHNCCQIALVDMRLRDDNDETDISGLELANKLKPTETIIISGFLNTRKIRQIVRQQTVFDFIGKEDMPGSVEEVLNAAAQSLCASEHTFAIQSPDLLAAILRDFSDHNVIAAEDEIQDILVRLFPEASRLEVNTFTPEQATWDASSVPRPKSVILRVAETVDGVRRQPKVVKLARAEKMETEVKRFYKHINGRLVGAYHPTLEKNAILWNLGGAVYTMLGEASEGVRQFSNMYSHEPPEVIQPILSQFFGETWSDLYTTTREYTEASLFDTYCAVWGRKWFDERVKGFYGHYAKDWMQAGDWPEYATPEPMRWLVENVDRTNDASRLAQVGVAATHGDLHGDNLLIDRNNHAWVIDFERSGPGHILQDLIELEADILNRLTCGSFDSADFYRLCILALRNENLQPDPEAGRLLSPPARKALDVISFLRRIATDHIHQQNDAREYYWGLLFNALFRASISDVNTDHCLDRPLRLAGMICHRLEHWGAPWPPANWPTID